MLITRLPAAGDVPPRADRVWYAPEPLRIPAREPGRAERVARIYIWRLLDDRAHEWDERIETSLCALDRYLWRRAHGQRSARWACSLAQLIDSPFAEVLGWRRHVRGGRVYYFYADGVTRMTRAQFIRAHRKQLQRWLDALQDCGLVRHTPERDNRGQWWRTVIELQAVEPIADEALMRKVRRRLRGFRARERRRQARRRVDAHGVARPPRRRRLDEIVRRSAKPNSATRRRLALGRQLGRHERDRRRSVEHGILIAAERRAAHAAAAPTRAGQARGHLTHPYGASPTVKLSPQPQSITSPRIRSEVGQTAESSFIPLDQFRLLAEESGARVSDHTLAAVARFRAELLAWESEGVSDARTGSGCSEVVRAPRATPWRDDDWMRDRFAVQLQARAQRVLGCAVGETPTWAQLRDAWAVLRYGLDAVLDDEACDPLRARGAYAPRTRRMLFAAIALYDRHVDERPEGWPASGAAALTVIAADHRPGDLAGDVVRLDQLARRMAARARYNDAERLRAAQRRAQARLSVTGPSPDLAAMLDAATPRTIDALMARWLDRRRAGGRVDPEQLRRELRDHLLAAGEHPGHGPAARAFVDEQEERIYRHRYAHERAGTWEADQPERSPYPPDGMTRLQWTYNTEIADGIWRLPRTWLERRAELGAPDAPSSAG